MSPHEYFGEFNVTPVQSVEHAREKLVMVKPLVADLVNNFEQFRVEFLKLQQVAGQNGSVDDILKARLQVDMLEERLNTIRYHILNHNVVLRDWQRGLIDFAAIRNGEPVWLCYYYGEQSLNHYHGFNGGFQSRRIIDFM